MHLVVQIVANGMVFSLLVHFMVVQIVVDLTVGLVLNAYMGDWLAAFLGVGICGLNVELRCV